MAKLKVAINGFGRIGRLVFRAGQEQVKNGNMEFVVVNDLCDVETMATLLELDSTHGRYKGEIKSSKEKAKIDGIESVGRLIVDGKDVIAINEKDPAKIPWKSLGIDAVVESTGVFRKRADLMKHINSGVSYVLLTVPADKEEDVDKTIVIGINDNLLTLEDKLISNASCTTNCLAPMAYVLQKEHGIEKGSMITIHAYTNDQKIIDFAHKDLRRARSAASNIIPTSTGAAKAINLIIPELKGKMDGIAMRVPVADGSLTCLVADLSKEATKEEINKSFEKYAQGSLSHILEYTEKPIVSSDIIGNPMSCIFDANLTKVIGNQASVFGWYDNEWGYSNRCIDILMKINSFNK